MEISLSRPLSLETTDLDVSVPVELTVAVILLIIHIAEDLR